MGTVRKGVCNVVNGRTLSIAVSAPHRGLCIRCLLAAAVVVAGVAALVHPSFRTMVLGGGLLIMLLIAASLRDCRTLYVDAYGMLLVDRCFWRRTKTRQWWREELAAVQVNAPPADQGCELIVLPTIGGACVVLGPEDRQLIESLCEEIKSRLALPTNPATTPATRQ